MQPVCLAIPDKSEWRIQVLRERFSALKAQDVHRSQKGKGRAVTSGARLTMEDVQRLRQHWQEEFADIVNGTKEELPPWCEVNHKINLIDDTKQYKYHLPWCPMALQQQLQDKTNQYLWAHWWAACSAPQAAPLLCIPKKDGTLQMALDARQRNDNTIKDVTPLLNQEVIREDVA